MFSTMTLWLSW